VVANARASGVAICEWLRMQEQVEWLFVSGCECKSPNAVATECINLCRDGTDMNMFGDHVIH
jgi:hypothetical protein